MQCTSPKVLYKYQSGESHHLRGLQEGTIRFTQPSDLNDPWDSIPEIAEPRDFLAFVRNTAKRNLDNLKILYPAATEDQIDGIAKSLAESYKRDPTDLLQRTDIIVRRNMDMIGVLSLSESWNVMPMWAHYAGNHAGFVLELATGKYPLARGPHDRADSGTPMRVAYGGQRPTISPDDMKMPLDALLWKDKDWAFEREWRVIRERSACDITVQVSGPKEVSLCRFTSDVVTCIIFGLKTSNAGIASVRRAIDGGPLVGVAFDQVTQDPGSGALVRKHL